MRKLHPKSLGGEGVLQSSTRAFCRLKIVGKMSNKSDSDGEGILQKVEYEAPMRAPKDVANTETLIARL